LASLLPVLHSFALIPHDLQGILLVFDNPPTASVACLTVVIILYSFVLVA
jgi:hypothetical protein